MPEVFSATVAEREAELLALQSAFDEYIASSRELEEELDAELAKMQEKLAESTAANRALSAQLENIAPQLTSLESSLTDSRRKLKEEQQLRRAAEQAQDEADQRIRELEESIAHVREEADAVHEELAFKENELEETKLELEVDKQGLEDQIQEIKARLATAEARNAARETSLMDDATEDNKSDMGMAKSMDTADSGPSVDEAYVKKLEEELELVTEQLIETENRLSETEGTMDALKDQIEDLKSRQRVDEEEEELRRLQTENADYLDREQRLREDITIIKEELTLAKEEIQLTQEELAAAEEDRKNLLLTMDEERAQHKEEVTQLSIAMTEAEIAAKSSIGDASGIAKAVQDAEFENQRLADEVLRLEAALENAKQDYSTVLEELEAVNSRFDESRLEAEQFGRQAAAGELREQMQADLQHEISNMKTQLEKLQQENVTLQQKVDDTEMSLASLKDNQDEALSGEQIQSAVVKQLTAQLERAKEDLSKKEAEIAAITTGMEERLREAEDKTTRLEGDLRTAKGQLAETEARVIVLRREKDEAQNSIPPPSPKRAPKPMIETISGPGMPSPSFLKRASLDERDELSSMDEGPTSRRLRTPTKDRPRSTSPASVIRLTYRLDEEQKKYTDLQKEYNKLQDQKRMGEVRIKRLEDDLKLLHKELFARGGDTAVVTQMNRLSSLATTDLKEVNLINQGDEDEANHVLRVIESRDPRLMGDELRSLSKKFNAQRDYNAQLLSKMLHLQGNIQVYCRVRPMTINEIQKGYKEIVQSLSETELGCFDARTNKWKSFAFDRVWGTDQSQTSVFQDVEPLALSVVDGFNACIFAYGQTGSGKTFTMEGVAQDNQYGISYRTIQKIFHLLNLRAQQQRAAEMFMEIEDADGAQEQVSFEFEINIGMLEIYNEEIYDLLSAQGSSTAEKKIDAMRAGGKASLEIRRDDDGRVVVPNLTKEKVHGIQEVMALLKRGNSNRATAATDLNEHSSRSHMVLMVEVTSSIGGASTNKGTLYLVDLAGSERVRKSKVSGDQLKEAGFINKSLSALGNVMEALDRKASHIPFRDSKLTYLLQDSLGGNSRTMMIVAICPNDQSYDESVHALQFATRVRRIQIGAAQRNVTNKNLEETVKALTEEMKALSRAKERSENSLHTLKRDNARVQEKLKNLSTTRTQSKSESKTLEVLRKNNDDMAARWQKEKTAREALTEELDSARQEQRTLQQQVGKMKSKLSTLERKLEEKETELDGASKRLRQERNVQSATTVRARRDEVLNSRQRPAVPISVSKSHVAPSPSRVQPNAASADISNAAADVSIMSETDEILKIRDQVLALLESHDQGKVNRIDIIMDKFKGKEALLLEKMTQRYEGTASSAATFQKRNEIALQRHQERMRKIREKQEGSSAGGGTINSSE